MACNLLKKFGGRSRTRTCDPLIKRQLFHIVERAELNHFR